MRPVREGVQPRHMTARKEYTCTKCEQPIRKGDQYIALVRTDSSFYQTIGKLHEICWRERRREP